MNVSKIKPNSLVCSLLSETLTVRLEERTKLMVTETHLLVIDFRTIIEKWHNDITLAEE